VAIATLAERGELSRAARSFLRTEAGSAVLLLTAAVLALLWTNVAGGYEEFWHTDLTMRFGETEFGLDLRHWVNDGLMVLFFLSVGLEISRETTLGELRGVRALIAPAFGALGGLVVPAGLYLLALADGPGAVAWGVPISTDTAVLLGVLALVGPRCPDQLRVFLLALAIVDDIGSVLVVALVSTVAIHAAWLAFAFALAALLFVFPRIHVRATPVYVALGIALWYATYQAGVHPALAGAAVGLLTPSEPFQRPRAVSEQAHRTADLTQDDPEQADADAPHWLRLSELSR